MVRILTEALACFNETGNDRNRTRKESNIVGSKSGHKAKQSVLATPAVMSVKDWPPISPILRCMIGNFIERPVQKPLGNMSDAVREAALGKRERMPALGLL